MELKKGSRNLFINHYYSTFKYHYWLGIRSLGELIIDILWCKFEPGFEVLENNSIFKIIYSLTREEK